MKVGIKKRRLRSGRISFYTVAYHAGGRRTYEIIENLTNIDPKDKFSMKEAMNLARQVSSKRQLLYAADANAVYSAVRRSADFIEFCQAQADAKRSTNYRESWKAFVTHLKRFVGGKATGEVRLPFSAIDETWIEAFRDYLEKNFSTNTARQYFTLCRIGIRAGYKAKHLSSDFTTRVNHLKSEDAKRDFLTLPELQQLAATPCRNPKLGRAFLFSCFAGLRWSDAVTLRWADVRLADGVPVQICFRQVKTGELLQLPLNEQASMFISAAKQEQLGDGTFKPDGVVFGLGSQMSGTVWTQLRDWGAAAGITKKIHYHTSRHTFISNLLLNGASEFYTSRLAGHRSTRTTALYSHALSTKMFDTVNLLPTLKK